MNRRQLAMSAAHQGRCPRVREDGGNMRCCEHDGKVGWHASDRRLGAEGQRARMSTTFDTTRHSALPAFHPIRGQEFIFCRLRNLT